MAGYRMIAGGMVVMALFSGAAAAQRPGFGERLRELRAARQQASADVDGATRQTLTFAGRERSYALLDGHKGGTPAPLVIVLHGGGGNGSTMLPRWADKARSEAQLEQCFWKRHFCSMTCTHRRECYHYIFGFG